MDTTMISNMPAQSLSRSFASVPPPGGPTAILAILDGMSTKLLVAPSSLKIDLRAVGLSLPNQNLGIAQICGRQRGKLATMVQQND